MVCTVGVGTSAEYYLNEQSSYYTEGKEPVGRWYMPDCSFGLGHGAEIEAQVFQKLHSGYSPDGQQLSVNNHGLKENRVGGYDLTFSAPKSVSVLWAVAEPELRASIEHAQEQAVRSALDVFNDQAAFARRGKGGKTLEQVALIGATFQHGEARPTLREDGSLLSDPQLHTHAVIFNLAEREDGTWGALDGRQFFRWKMAAGALYRAELAHQLQKQIGLDVEVDEKGLFEIKGVSEDVRQHFSSRRAEITAALGARGLESQDAPALAADITLGTRRSKSMQTETAEQRHERWQEEVEQLGFVISNVMCECTEDMPEPIDLDAVADQLTEHEAVFTKSQLYRVVSEHALSVGLRVEDVESAVAELMTSDHVVELGADTQGQRIYSTREMIATEREVVRLAQSGSLRQQHKISEKAVSRHIEGASLTEEQADAVRFVTEKSDVCVLEGAAGAGKTHALKTVAAIYQDQGYRVIGTSTAWRMANQLGDELGVLSKATDAWLAEAKAGKLFLDNKTVLIVDEAGLLSSRQMLKVLQVANEAKSKLILTGDQRQLQAIGAGPGLRLVAEQTGVARIDTIVRQKDQWARQMVSNLSLGRSEQAMQALQEHNCLHWCANSDAATKQAVQDWQLFKLTNPEKTAMVLAQTNVQVRALNAGIREQQQAANRLGQDACVLRVQNGKSEAQELPIAVGEQILFKKRIDDLGVINGALGTVKRIEQRENWPRLTVQVGEREIRFNSNDIADNKGRAPIAHAYATTVYSAQGATVDAAFVLAEANMKRNEIYVAASRAKENIKIYLDKSEAENLLCSQLPLNAREQDKQAEGLLFKHIATTWAKPLAKSSALGCAPIQMLRMHKRYAER